MTMAQKTCTWCAILAGLAAFSPQPVLADDGNYQNYVIGERAAGMGGAGTAVATGAEACYYNPAGLTLAAANSISLSAALYGFHRRSIRDGWFPGEDVGINSFTSIPSTFGAVIKSAPDLVLAFSAFVPDKQYTNDLEAFPHDPNVVGDEHFYRYVIDDQTLWVGPSAARRLTPEWSVGLSLFATYRTYSRIIDIFLLDRYFSQTTDIRYSALSLLGEAGVRFDPGGSWSFGLMMQSPSFHLAGQSDLLMKSEDLSQVGLNFFNDGESRNKLPAAIRAGASWQKSRRYAVALDATYHFPVTYDRISGRDNWGGMLSLPVKRLGVVDFNLGGEYFLAPRYPVRAGLFTSFSSAPATSLTSPYMENHINKYGVTLSVGKETANTTLGVGLSYVLGGGRGIGLSSTPTGIVWALVDEKDSYLLVNLSSSYSF